MQRIAHSRMLVATLVAAMAATVLLIPASIAAAKVTTPRPLGFAQVLPGIGPPLGYYYTEVNDCRRDVHMYDTNKAFHDGCNQDAQVVIAANETTTCSYFTALEIVPVGLLPPAQIGVLQAMSVIGLAVACS